MKRINEFFENFIAAQLAHLMKVLIEEKAKVVSMIVPDDSYKAIVLLLSKSSVKHRAYQVDTFKLILISFDESLFELIEESNNQVLSKELREYFIGTIC